MERVAAIDKLTLADLVPIMEASVSSQESAADAQLEGAGKKAVSDLYCDASRRLADFCASSPYRGDWACEVGCSACCFQSVPVTAIETLTLADFLCKALPAREQSDLRVRLRQNIERWSTAPSAQVNDAPTPCPLLGDDQKCSAYPVRPLRCRGFHSLCAAECQAQRQGDPQASPPIDPQTNVAMRGIQSGLSGALRRQGKDGNYYRLESALWRALETSNATQRWEQGEDIFAGCVRSVAAPDSLWIAPQDDGSIVELRRQDNQPNGPKIELVHMVPRL